MNPDYIIFIDFDGTITTEDVGYEMFKKFTLGRTETVVGEYRFGKINSLRCLSDECLIWNSNPPDQNDVFEYLGSREVSPGFAEFLEFLNCENISSVILSEGFDFYIDRILQSHGIEHPRMITNRARYNNGKLLPEFPYFGRGCGQCSNCKGYHISRLRSPGQSAVFIGDGHSDHHGAQTADIVLAKSFLKDFLRAKELPFYEYDDFRTVINSLKNIVGRHIFTSTENIDFCRISEKHRGKLRNLWESGEVMKYVGYPHGLGWSDQQYENFWKRSETAGDRIRLALENKSGDFIGEAKISFPDRNNHCTPDLKLLPKFQGRGFGREAWNMILKRTYSRWPDSTALVTPSTDNLPANELYLSLGFKYDGGEEEWVPSPDYQAALPVRFRKMTMKLNEMMIKS